MQDAAILIKSASSSGRRLQFWAANPTWRFQLGQTPAIPSALPAATTTSAVTPQRHEVLSIPVGVTAHSQKVPENRVTGGQEELGGVTRSRGGTPKRSQPLPLTLPRRRLPDLPWGIVAASPGCPALQHHCFCLPLPYLIWASLTAAATHCTSVDLWGYYKETTFN